MELSVIVPIYNAAETLAATLDSLFSQHPLSFEWEIVAVDDGSTDESLLILKEYEKKAAGMGIVFRFRSFENGGVGKCRNRGLDLAQGKRVLYLDADDRLKKGALALLMKRAEETGAKLLLFDSEFLFADGRREPFPMADCAGGEMSEVDYLLSHPCPWNKLIERSLFAESGLRFPEGILYEDLAMIPALGGYAEGAIWYEKTCLHTYYQSSESIMRSPWSEKRMDLFSALETLSRNVRGQREAVEYLFFLHLYRTFVWQAWEARRRDALCRASVFMRKHFPNRRKNALIRSKTTRKERLVALLFEYRLFFLISLWKGGRI